jgi:FAD/FMN-containing dehydrogenase
MTAFVSPALDDLAADLAGRLVRPTDADYAALSTPWNVAVSSAPAAVVEAADAADVVAAVRFAARAGLQVDVRATGHGAAPVGASTLLVHTAGLDELTVHPDGWARVGAGVRWSDVLAAAAPHGLAPLCGSAPGVGVVGYLTGGGLGPVARTFGLSSDHVRAFDVVTGDGRLRRATRTENPALFWGLCGGKGALGVVTAVEFDLPRVSEILGGCLYFDGVDAAAVLHTWRTWTATLPEQASTSLAILRLPAMPGVPGPLAGRCTVAVRFAWVGDTAEGERVLAPMHAAAPVLLGAVAPMPYAQIGAIHADPVDPMPTMESAHLLGSLPREAADALLAVAGPNAECPQVSVELRLLGGAVARPVGPSAVCHRDAAFSLLLIGVDVPPLHDVTAAHAAEVAIAVAPWTAGGALPNFGGAATPERVRRTYDARTLERLATLAAAYDPDGVLACAYPVRAVIAPAV